MKKRRLSDAYQFNFYKPLQIIKNHPTHFNAIIISLKRIKKNLNTMIVESNMSVTFTVEGVQFI